MRFSRQFVACLGAAICFSTPLFAQETPLSPAQLGEMFAPRRADFNLENPGARLLPEIAKAYGLPIFPSRAAKTGFVPSVAYLNVKDRAFWQFADILGEMGVSLQEDYGSGFQIGPGPSRFGSRAQKIGPFELSLQKIHRQSSRTRDFTDPAQTLTAAPPDSLSHTVAIRCDPQIPLVRGSLYVSDRIVGNEMEKRVPAPPRLTIAPSILRRSGVSNTINNGGGGDWFPILRTRARWSQTQDIRLILHANEGKEPDYLRVVFGARVVTQSEKWSVPLAELKAPLRKTVGAEKFVQIREGKIDAEKFVLRCLSSLPRESLEDVFLVNENGERLAFESASAGFSPGLGPEQVTLTWNLPPNYDAAKWRLEWTIPTQIQAVAGECEWTNLPALVR